jgi:hypothetical protein
MANVGDRVMVESEKVGTPARTGTVVATMGPMLRISWDHGGESTFVPAVGSVQVLASNGAGSS